MTRARPAWHDEARALYRDGVPDIARRFGKQASQVRYLVDDEYHERRVMQVRAARARRVSRDDRPVRWDTDLRRKPKVKPATGPRVDTMALCRAFAAGEFDRGELSRRLRGAP